MGRNIGGEFRDLHRKGEPFVLANVWDAGSAKMLASYGAQALATSSAAHAFTLGRPDLGQLTRDEALDHAQLIVAATPLPVQGDFENGFGDDPETCAETVRLAAEIGLAGICIEDTALPGTAPYDRELSIERIRAAAAAARALSHDFVLTARADGLMHGTYDLDEAAQRFEGFEAAGADCLYAPMPPDMTGLKRLIDHTALPVNVLVAGRYARHSQADFAALGAARLSLGSALARVIHRAIRDTSLPILNDGDFTGLSEALPGAEVDALLGL